MESMCNPCLISKSNIFKCGNVVMLQSSLQKRQPREARFVQAARLWYTQQPPSQRQPVSPPLLNTMNLSIYRKGSQEKRGSSKLPDYGIHSSHPPDPNQWTGMQAIAEQHDDYTIEKVHVPPSHDCRTVERLYIDKRLPVEGRITNSPGGCAIHMYETTAGKLPSASELQ